MSESNPKLYVITGGPCSGKSTLVAALAARGHATLPEFARIIIKEHMDRGMTAEELMSDFIGFNKKVLAMQLESETRFAESGKTEVAFLDRGIVDNIGYCNESGKDGSFMNKHVTEGRYAKVFFLEPVPYAVDKERREDEARAKRISEHIFKAYRDSPYELVRVPLMTVEERVEFVLANINVEAKN